MVVFILLISTNHSLKGWSTFADKYSSCKWDRMARIGVKHPESGALPRYANPLRLGTTE